MTSMALDTTASALIALPCFEDVGLGLSNEILEWLVAYLQCTDSWLQHFRLLRYADPPAVGALGQTRPTTESLLSCP